MNQAQILALSLPVSRTFRIGFSQKIVWAFLALIVLALSLVCIFQINAYTGELYLNQEYERDLAQLSQENKVLEITFSQAGSLDKMGTYAQLFEKATEVEYIRVLESTALAK